jgi:SMODS-associated and fused to various effectors sensor domain
VTPNWTWKKSGKPVDYEFRLVQSGRNQHRVALILSLSGTIARINLPNDIDDSFSVYELTLKGVIPNTTFLRTRRDLENFRSAYQIALGTITQEHAGLGTLHLFPAVPAPVAVLCGRELLPKVHPRLWVYDYNKANNGFTFALEV